MNRTVVSAIKIIFVASIIGSLIYCMINGFPLTKILVKRDISIYLKNRYAEDMEVDYVKFSIAETSYYAIAHQKSNSQIAFKVLRYKNKVSKKYEFFDKYPVALWSNEVNSKLEPFVKSIFSEKDYGFISISQNPFIKEDLFKGNKIIVPNYNDIKEQIRQYSKIDIWIKRNFDKSKEGEEFKKIFEVVEFIKKMKYEPNDIIISFNDEVGEIDWSMFNIPYENMLDIKSEKDIIKYKKSK